MTNVPDIVCLSPNHWSGLSTSKKHLMQVFSREGKVLFVEPPADLASVLARRRRWYKLRGVSRAGAGPFVMPSVTASTTGTTGWRRRFHAARVETVRRVADDLGFERPILWTFSPEHIEYAGALDEALLVYHVADEPASLARDREVTEAADRELAERADVVFAVSARLAGDRRSSGTTHLLRNAADRRHYSKTLAGDADACIERFVRELGRSDRRPSELRGAEGPLVLFGGAAYDWFDRQLLLDVAAERPEWRFVLVGPKGRSLAAARMPENVISVGRRSYDEFPHYVAAADVTFMPVRPGQTFDTCDPIVVYEYLLCGKQVVATPFPAAAEHSGLVRTAASPSAFAGEIERALEKAGDPAEIRRRVEYGFANTWEDRAAEALEVIESAMNGAGRHGGGGDGDGG